MPSKRPPDASASPLNSVDETRASLRKAMLVTEKWAYFDHASVAPLCKPSLDAIQKWTTDASQQGDVNWLSWDQTVETARSAAAFSIHASPNEIAMVSNTTAGINLVAGGLDWKEGDNVVVLADEFPSNLYPWLNLQRQGVETRLVATDNGKLSLDRLRESCDERTRVISVSWVGYTTGYRQQIDKIAEIAHQAGGKNSSRAYFFLDAIQGLGALPLDVTKTPIDFMAADGHKWMLGPEGAGIAYIRKENLELLTPHGLGWHSVVDSQNFGQFDLNLKPAASRFEGGSANMPGMHALAASLNLLQQIGPQAIEAAVLDITDYLCQRMEEIGVTVVSHREKEANGHDPRSGIVAVLPLEDENPERVRLRCLERGIVVRCRGGRVRCSPHAYVTHEEVDQLVDAIADK